MFDEEDGHAALPADLRNLRELMPVDRARADEHFADAVPRDQRLEVGERAQHRQALHPHPPLLRIVVHEAHGAQVERAVLEQLAHEQHAAAARAVDERRAPAAALLPQILVHRGDREP